MNKHKKLTAIVLIMALLASAVPTGGIIEVVHAAPNSMNILFQRIQDPTGKDTLQYVISYSSDYPLNEPVIEITDEEGGGASYRIDTVKYKEADLIFGNQIIIERDHVLQPGVYGPSYAAIFNDGKKTIKVTNKLPDGTNDASVTKSFDVVSPPKILSTNIVNKTLFVGDSLTVLGSNFDAVNTVLVDGVSYNSIVPQDGGTKITVTINSAGIKTGEIRMYKDTNDGELVPTTYSNAIQSIYQNSAYVVSRLTQINIDMVQPNTGSVNGGTYVKIRNAAGQTGLNDQVKVYFPRVINGVMEPLSTANLATANSFDPLTNTLTVRTKASTSGPGDARIVITSPDGTSRYDDRDNPLLYTFVEAGNALTLNNITPPNAKASAQAKVTLIGKNIGTLNVTGLSYPAGEDFSSSITNVLNQTSGDVTTTYITLSGLKYNLNNQEYTVDVVKKINVVVGGSAKTVVDAVYGGFTPESSFSIQQDQLYIQLPIVNLGVKEFETYDAVVSTETFIYYDGDDADTDLDDQLIPSKLEEATLSNSFTYSSDFVVPTVTTITPGYGPRDKKISVRITGANFYVLQQATQKLKPIVKIGIAPLDANVKVLENVRVINGASGIEVDGSTSNYRGDTIIGDIPASPDGNINIDANIYVYNPDAYNAADPDNIIYFGQPGILNAKFKFFNPNATQYPRIIDVSPNLVSSAGGEDITITGSNFKTNSELYVDGQKVTPITISGTGETLTFKSPKGSPGVVSLQVFNPDSGAMAGSILEYTSIYTSPGITKITPNKGGPNTLVTITGKNFLSSDVTAKPEEVYKLIGARVKFNNKDLNSYNMSTSGTIMLKDYNYQSGTPKPVFKAGAVFDTDYRDVVFIDDAHDGVFLLKEEQGIMYLKDGNGNRFRAFVDENDTIKLVNQNSVTSSEITYDYDGYTPDEGEEGTGLIMTFTFDGIPYRLKAQTPYLIKTQGGISTITGNMVRIIDDTTLEVTIPPLIPSQGNNDVTVINPDTAFATKKDGFFYFGSMGSKPVIQSLEPNEASIFGGTIVKITGEAFREGVEIYFGSEKATSVVLSANQKVIYAVLPAYPKSLPKGVGSVTVPVVILNPTDGGTTVWDQRFTYRVPTSYPEITTISPNRWNASGGIDVTIYGKNFVQGEPYTDLNGNGRYDADEPYIDLYNIGSYDETCIAEDEIDGVTVRTVIPELAPKVYFGGELAIVKDFLYNRLIVELPSYSGSGAVDVVIVNPDTGTVVKKGGFTYSVSAPKITSIVPAVGPKAGGTEVTIKGQDFIVEDIKVFVGSSEDKAVELISGGTLAKTITMGNLTVNYNALNPPQAGNNTALTMTFSAKFSDSSVQDVAVTKYINMEEEKTDYQVTFEPEDFITAEPDINAGEFAKLMAEEESVNLRIADSQMQVMRRLAAVDAVNSNDKTLIIHTPPASLIGVKDLQIINNDGGTATGQFEYGNPVSIPRIDEVKPNRRVDYTLGGEPAAKYLVEVSTKGGEQIRILGRELRDGVKVMIGDQMAEVLGKTDFSNGQSELLVKVPVPNTANKNVELKITVINSDMASAVSTDYPASGTKPTGWYPYWFVYKDSSTNPAITRVTPNQGPRIGGTTITIEGDDFREGARVFIGGLECTDVEIISYKQIVAVTAPLSAPITEPGSYAVEVKNYENGVLSGTAILENGFTYVSSPVITGIFEAGTVDAEGNYAKGAEVTELRVTGGELVMLEVTDLQPNPTIVMGGKIVTITDYSNIPQGIRGMNSKGQDVVVTGGAAAAIVQTQGKTYAVIRTPALTKSENSTIIIINADTGISNSYGAPYIMPVPEKPLSLKAEAVDGDTIRIEWGTVAETQYYEVFLSESEDGKKKGEYLYLASIVPGVVSETVLRYFIEGLQPDTYYSVKLRAVNQYGASSYSNATPFKKTPDDITVTYYQPEEVQRAGFPLNDSIKATGTGVAFIAGEKSLGNKDKGVVADFGQTAYYAANPKTVDISFGLIKKYPGNKINISDRSLQLELTANSLAVDEMIRVEAAKAMDAVVRITLNRALGAREDVVRISIPKGYKALMSPVGIEVSMQVQSQVSRIRSLKTAADLTVRYDEALQKNYPGGVYIGFYDNETKKLQLLSLGAAAKGSASAKVIRSGEYVLIGKLFK